MREIYVRCPECKHPINVTAVLREQADAMDDGMLPETMYGRLYCSQCDDFTEAFFLQPEREVDPKGKNTVLRQLAKDILTHDTGPPLKKN